MNWGQVKTEIRLRLQDLDGSVWADSELLRTANDVLDDISLKCEAHLRQYNVLLTPGTRAYSLPENCVEIRRVAVNHFKMYGRQPYQLEELDAQYLTRTGTPVRYYLDNLRTLAFHPVPEWTPSLTAFLSELGVLVELTESGTRATFDGELGVVIDLLESTGDATWIVYETTGAVVQMDARALVAQITHTYRMNPIQLESDALDLPELFSWMLIYGTLEAVLQSEGQNQNLILAGRYGTRYAEWIADFRARNLESLHAPNQYLSQRPLKWGSDMDWRERTTG